jgi:hypothetical protein
VITDHRVFLNENVLLTTKVNLGDRRAGRIEFSVMACVPPNMKFRGFTLPNIRFMFNGNWAHTEQDRTDVLGLTCEKRTGSSLQLRGGGQWQITPTDVLTVMTFHQGKQLSGEGYREPFGILNLAYSTSSVRACHSISAPTMCSTRPTRNSASRRARCATAWT